MMLIKVQVWRDKELAYEATTPVHPSYMWQDFVMPHTLIDGDIALYNIRMEQQVAELKKETEGL